jgi:hypothetical protein
MHAASSLWLDRLISPPICGLGEQVNRTLDMALRQAWVSDNPHVGLWVVGCRTSLCSAARGCSLWH